MNGNKHELLGFLNGLRSLLGMGPMPNRENPTRVRRKSGRIHYPNHRKGGGVRATQVGSAEELDEMRRFAVWDSWRGIVQ